MIESMEETSSSEELKDPVILFELMGFHPDPNDLKEYYYSFEDYAPADWEAVGERLRSHPKEASALRYCIFFERQRQHPLHCALNIADNPIPPHIIQQLLQAYPQAIQVEVARLAHLAFTNYHIPSKSIEILLNANPQLAQTILQNGQLPLHKSSSYGSSELLIRTYPQALAIPDNNGCIPLYYAILSETPAHVRLFLEEGINYSVDADHGAGGLFLVNSRGQSSLDLAVHMTKSELTSRNNGSNNNRHLFYSKQHQGFKKLCLCLQACATSKLGHVSQSSKANLSEHPVLHATIEFVESYQIIEHACQTYTDDLTKLDRHGRTALSIALERWNDIQFVSPDSNNSNNVEEEALQNKQKLIHYLCQNTNACSIPDNNGTLPLTKLLRIDHSHTYSRCIIQKFIQNEPRSIGTRDPSTHLYPFMTAAIKKKGQRNEDTSNINAVFDLLLENPSLLQKYTK